jgi:chemotaxis methyl-accepting protein methylase
LQRTTLHPVSRSVSAETGLDGTVVDDILRALKRHTGVDFTGYRRATLERRIANRMLSVLTPSSKQYLELLLSSKVEAARLLERLTIKVSRFYRYSLAFDVLRMHVLPELARQQLDRPLAVWSVGCGAGEEPYTLAMLFDAAGISSEIHATDVDRSALELASSAVFASSALRELPADLSNVISKSCRMQQVAEVRLSTACANRCVNVCASAFTTSPHCSLLPHRRRSI